MSRKKDEKFYQFLVLFLSVGIFNFILLYRKLPVGCFLHLRVIIISYLILFFALEV